MPRKKIGGEVEALKRERQQLQKRLKQIEKSLSKERRTRKRKKLKLTTKRIKERKARATRLRRNIKSITNVFKKIRATKAKRNRKVGTPKQRKAGRAGKNLKARDGRKYGEQRVWTFNGYNERTNFNSIEDYLYGLLRRSKSNIIRVRVNLDALFKRKPEGDTAVKLKGGKFRYAFSIFSASLKNPSIQDLYKHYGSFAVDTLIAPYEADIVRNSKTGQLRIFKIVVTATIT